MLTDEREWGETFAPDEICWFDFESKNKTEKITAGTYRYATTADAIVLAYAIGDGPETSIAVPDFSRALRWSDVPADLKAAFRKAERGEMVFAAWNAAFDKAIWNFATEDFPAMEPDYLIDVMVQATANGLPPDLKAAAKASRSEDKVESGGELIKLFCLPESTATPQSHPKEWQEFKGVYATGDITSMRSVFKGTRQLALAEWREYQAMEKINERGVAVDLELVYRANKLAHEDKKRSMQELPKLTGGVVTTVDQVKRIGEWLLDRLPPAGRDMLIKREEEVDDNGVVLKPPKLALTRARVEKMEAYATAMAAKCEPGSDEEKEWLTTLRVLQIRRYGGSKTPAKYGKILGQHVDGKLFGQYTFGGAPQTGRASSKGVQIHNLSRDALKYEHDLIEAVLNDESYDHIALLGDNTPVSRKLSLMIRPTFVPENNRVFVWSDWSQIEARITPWLAGNVAGALERLQIFREVDATAHLPEKHPDKAIDLYTRTAAKLSHIPVEQVTKPIRQRGKVAELALSFLGGVGALQAMGAGYGLYLSDEESKIIVDQWRLDNQWAVDFGGVHNNHASTGLWGAFCRSMEQPGVVQTAGRISYIYLAGYLGGSILCILPSGRCLTYRAVKYERVEDFDDDDNSLGWSTYLRYSKGHSRVKIWRGVLVENATQAVAADFLRGTIRRLEDDPYDFYVRINTHDEILGECPERVAPEYARRMQKIMRKGFDWSKGLPIFSEEDIGYQYTKCEELFWHLDAYDKEPA